MIKQYSIAVLSLLISLFSGTQAIAQQTPQARTITPASVSGDLVDIRYAYDGRLDTRAYSPRPNYVGMSVTIDTGSRQNIIGVKQDYGRWPTHYPGGYKVEVAESEAGPWMVGFEGAGQRGESRAEFRAILARFIRITATTRNRVYDQGWSIAELKVGVDPGQTPRRIPDNSRPPRPEPPQSEERELKDPELARDGKLNTRATSGMANYSRMHITIDLGGEYEVSRVVQLHGSWQDDYPREYRVEVSRQRNEARFREVWSGSGEPNRSVARFQPVTTRFIRITAIRERDRYHWWSIAELRTNRDEDVAEDDTEGRVERQIRGITARGFENPTAVIDRRGSRATTNNPNYTGSWIQADLGGSYTISRVVQIHSPSDEDYPGRYRIDVSLNGRNWRTVHEGVGRSGRSSAAFQPVRARFVRIIALDNRDVRQWWSIHSLSIRE
jgi:hypothetical protein